jgi:predicted DNA-binding ribbon-helix-helix protein
MDGGIAAKSSRSRMQQRILQSGGRRYSLRLEHCYWDSLANIAARQGVRINRLVADIAGRVDGANLASSLRAFCLEETERAALRLETPAGRTSVVTLVETAPVPALAVDASGRIAVANAPLLEWIGAHSETLLGTPLLRHFRIHGRAGLDIETLWQEHDPAATLEAARMIHIVPGRVLTANVRLIPVKSARSRSLCVIWIVK